MAGRMSVQELEAYCLGKPGAWADNPWSHDHPVIKVAGGPSSGSGSGSGRGSGSGAGSGAGLGKIFAFLGSGAVGVKAGASREEADEWLRRYPDDASVMPYIGRSGWNNLALAGAIPDQEIREAVDESYALVVSRLARRHRPDGWDQA